MSRFFWVCHPSSIDRQAMLYGEGSALAHRDTMKEAKATNLLGTLNDVLNSVIWDKGCDYVDDADFADVLKPPVAKKMLQYPVKKWLLFLQKRCPRFWDGMVIYYATMDEYCQSKKFMKQFEEDFEGKGQLLRRLISFGTRNIALNQPSAFDWWLQQMTGEEQKKMICNFNPEDDHIPSEEKYGNGFCLIDKIPANNLLKMLEPHRGTLSELFAQLTYKNEAAYWLVRIMKEGINDPAYAEFAREAIGLVEVKDADWELKLEYKKLAKHFESSSK